MATLTITPIKTFVSGETVLPATLNQLAQSTVALTAETIVAADIASDAVTTAKILDGNVTTLKIAAGNVTPDRLSQPLTLRTAQATTSGSAISFADIPSWAKRITVILNQVQNSGVAGGGNSAIIIQLGTSAGFKTSDYIATGTAITGSNLCGIGVFTAGFSAGTGVLSTSSRSGCLFLHNPGSNFWVASGTITNGTVAAGTSSGVVSLAGTLDRLQLTTVGGTDAFTGGSINIAYEG
jgi:hypothetical protein